MTEEEINAWVAKLSPEDKKVAAALFDWAYAAGAEDELEIVLQVLDEKGYAIPREGLKAALRKGVKGATND